MGRFSVLKSPKIEEPLVSDSVIAEFFERNDDNLPNFKSILGVKDGVNLGEGVGDDELNWDHMMEWDEFSIMEDDHDTSFKDRDEFENQEDDNVDLIRNMNNGFCGMLKEEEDQDREDEDDRKICLNLSLNYQEVIDAWSNRGPCWTEDFAHSTSDYDYTGEVPVMEEAKTKRATSILRYKEKRQSRLFCKKIRYQVRKLNADKRPRLKGRFVKRGS